MIILFVAVFVVSDNNAALSKSQADKIFVIVVCIHDEIYPYFLFPGQGEKMWLY